MPVTWFKSLVTAVTVASQLHSPVQATLTPQSSETCLKTCVMGEQGYSLIRTSEGYMPFPYIALEGNQTVAYGYVIQPGDKFTYPILPDQADQLLKKTVHKIEPTMNRLIGVPLRHNQFDALGCWTYNLGTGALKSSTMLKRVNAKRHKDVPPEMRKWNQARVKGVMKPVDGLTTRRNHEADLYAIGE